MSRWKQWRRRSELAQVYGQLAELIPAGVGVTEALEMIQRGRYHSSITEALGRTLQGLRGGDTLTMALRKGWSWLAPFDLGLFESGERSGRLEECLRLMADYHALLDRMERTIWSDLCYPLVVVHGTILFIPITQLVFSGDVAGYVLAVLKMVVALYGVVGAILWLWLGGGGARVRLLVEAISFRIPGLGVGLFEMCIARLSLSLEALISAGFPLIEAWNMSGKASGSPLIETTIGSWEAKVRMGSTPGELLLGSKTFPQLFAASYKTGEISGKLEETLRRLRGIYLENGTAHLHTFAQNFPKVAYGFGVGYMVFQILSGLGQPG